MAEFAQDTDDLPPQERLKKLREEQDRREKQRAELEARRKELEAREQEVTEEQDESEEKEEETLEEIAAEREKTELEETIRRLQEGEAQESIEKAREGIDYLLNAENISDERKLETEQNIYNSMRTVKEHANEVSESYAFNKLQEDMTALKQRGPQDNYTTRIQNVLNDILDYKN